MWDVLLQKLRLGFLGCYFRGFKSSVVIYDLAMVHLYIQTLYEIVHYYKN